MPTRREPAMVRRYRERVAAGGLPEGVKVVVRLEGGMPSERMEHEFELTGEGKTSVKRLDALSAAPRRAAAGEIAPEEARRLLQQIEAGLPELVRREDAHFLPDTLVGSVTLEIDGKAQTFFFAADEGAGEAPAMGLAPEPGMRSALRSINRISDQLLMESGGQDHE